MGGFEDAIVKAARTGKLEFHDMVNAILDDMLRMTIRQGITAPLSEGLGGFFSGLFNAHGNVLSGAGISSLSNGIYSSPTYFGYDNHATQFAKGGVLGEAGIEGVFPLARTSSGDLGVQAIGSGGGQQIGRAHV